jgi:hypothetical protein
LLIFLLSSCLTTTIILDDYEEIKLNKNDSCHEINIKLLQQIERLLENRAILIKYILMSDGTKIQVVDIRDSTGDTP